MFEAVLFDVDGLLVDTENLDLGVAIRVCKDLGIDLTEEEVESRVGVTSKKFYSELFAKRKLELSLKDILDKHFKIYDKLLEEELTHFPGAKTLPKILKSKGLKLALVSGSTRKQVEIILKQLGIYDYFNTIVTADDVEHGKPDPEGYLLSAKILNVNPENCVVLEDATPGVMAGKNAKMKVVGVINNGGQNLSSADLIIKHLDEFNLDNLK